MVGRLTPAFRAKAIRAPRWVPMCARRSILQIAVVWLRPRLLKIFIKAVDVRGAQIAKPDMADSLIDTAQVLCVGGYDLGFLVELGILCHVLFSKVGKAHIAFGGGAVQHLFLKQNCLLVQLLFDLSLRHSWSRHPGHILPKPLASIIITLGDSNFVTSTLLLYGCNIAFSSYF